MPALRYRQLQAPALIDTTPLENGDSEAATSLANAFKQFEGVGLDATGDLRAQQGAKEGTLAGAAGTPDFREGMRSLTAYGQAYNNAATRSYAIRAEADANDQIARMESESNNDPATFQAKFSAYRDETIKNAPPMARAALSTVYARLGGEAIGRVHQAQRQELHGQARADTAEGIERSTDRIAYLRSTEDPAKALEADEEQAKLGLLIDGAVNDGTLTAIEGQAMHIKTQRSIVEQTVQAKFQRELRSPYGDPVGFIEKLKKANQTSEALLPGEEDKLVNSLMSDLREQNALDSADKTRETAAEKARYEAGDRAATGMLLSGSLSVSTLRNMVGRQQLEPSTARTLLNELRAGDEAVDDPKVAFDARTNLLNYSEDDIRTMQGLTWKTRGDLLLKRREEADGWKGTQAAREGQDRIDRALGIVPGTMMQALSDDEKTRRNTALTEWYNLVDAMPPNERQSAVISTAEDVTSRYIRKSKAQQAQDLRGAKASYIQRAGDPNSMGDNARKAYQQRLQRYDADIAAAEAEAGRQ